MPNKNDYFGTSYSNSASTIWEKNKKPDSAQQCPAEENKKPDSVQQRQAEENKKPDSVQQQCPRCESKL